MTTTDASLARVAARQHGCVTSIDLRALGLDRRATARRVGQGLLIPVHPRVWRHAAVQVSRVGRVHAAVLASGPGAVASHRSAAHLHELRSVPSHRPEVTVPGTRLPLLAGVHAHRTDLLEAADVTTVDGVPTMTVARTLLCLGAVLPTSVVATAAQDALIRGLTSDVDLIAILERLGARGRRGTAALRAAVLAGLPPAGAQSRLEADLVALLRTRGLVPPVLQHELRTTLGLARLDGAWPDRRLAVEAGGRRWHSTTADFERDLRRSRAIVAMGWRHVRYGWTDVQQRPSEVLREVAELVAQPGAAAA